MGWRLNIKTPKYMITQDELLKLVKPWPIDYKPQFREPVCAKCGKNFRKAWHIHFIEYGYKREIHLCKLCGKNYNL